MKQELEWSVKVRRRTGEPGDTSWAKYGVIVDFEKPEQTAAAQAFGEKLLDADLSQYRVLEAECYRVVKYAPPREHNCTYSRPPSKTCESEECTRRHDAGIDYDVWDKASPEERRKMGKAVSQYIRENP